MVTFIQNFLTSMYLATDRWILERVGQLYFRLQRAIELFSYLNICEKIFFSTSLQSLKEHVNMFHKNVEIVQQ